MWGEREKERKGGKSGLALFIDRAEVSCFYPAEEISMRCGGKHRGRERGDGLTNKVLGVGFGLSTIANVHSKLP